MKTTPSVIFVTTEFDKIDNGPGTFARYLWDSFLEETEFDFYIIAASNKKHHRIINYSASTNSRQYYRNLETAISNTLPTIRKSSQKTIVHFNIPHSVSELPKDSFNIVQANDYDAVNLIKNIRSVYFEGSLRRIGTMYWRRIRERRIFKNADLVLANSEFTKDAIVDGYALKKDRVQRLYKAVDVRHFFPAGGLIDQGVNSGSIRQIPTLVFVGSNWVRKGIDLLIEAMIRLKAKGLAPRLTVVGPENAHRNQYWVQKVRSSTISDQVCFVGRVSREDLPGVLWQCDIGVLPSRHEALGVAIIEYMAAGLPVIASRTGGIPEIVRNNSEGLLFDNQSVPALCDAIEAMIRKEHFRTMKQNALSRAQYFSRTNMVDSLKKIYLSAFNS